MSIALPKYRLGAFAFVTAALLVALGGFSSFAQAACSYPNAEQVFSEYGDNAYYELAPDGGLEGGGTGWEFTGGAELVAGSETGTLNDRADQVELKLPFGAVAISPRVCVDETTPQFRLMTINTGKKDTKLKIRVMYEFVKSDGKVGTQNKDFEIRAANVWAPTEPLELKTDREQERVARIVFTPKEKEGNWLIDDLYVDPFARH